VASSSSRDTPAAATVDPAAALSGGGQIAAAASGYGSSGRPPSRHRQPAAVAAATVEDSDAAASGGVPAQAVISAACTLCRWCTTAAQRGSSGQMPATLPPLLKSWRERREPSAGFGGETHYATRLGLGIGGGSSASSSWTPDCRCAMRCSGLRGREGVQGA